MWPTLLRRSAVPKFPFNIHDNPYKAKRLWPPDFTQLSTKHQFRLERRYRRRAKLKWARPTWTKAVIIAQWGTGIFVVVYSVLFMDWGREDTPFEGIRAWYKDKVNSLWSTNTTRPLRRPEPRSNPADSPQT